MNIKKYYKTHYKKIEPWPLPPKFEISLSSLNSKFTSDGNVRNQLKEHDILIESKFK